MKDPTTIYTTNMAQKIRRVGLLLLTVIYLNRYNKGMHL